MKVLFYLEDLFPSSLQSHVTDGVSHPSLLHDKVDKKLFSSLPAHRVSVGWRWTQSAWEHGSCSTVDTLTALLHCGQLWPNLTPVYIYTYMTFKMYYAEAAFCECCHSPAFKWRVGLSHSLRLRITDNLSDKGSYCSDISPPSSPPALTLFTNTKVFLGKHCYSGAILEMPPGSYFGLQRPGPCLNEWVESYNSFIFELSIKVDGKKSFESLVTLPSKSFKTPFFLTSFTSTVHAMFDVISFFYSSMQSVNIFGLMCLLIWLL